MQKKIKSKRLFSIFVVLFIVLIILIITLEMSKKLIENKDKIPDDLKHINGDVEDESDKYEYPYMAYMFFIEYKGDLTPDDIVKSMSIFANELLPKYYKELKNATNEEVGRYYENNKTEIYTLEGIDNKEDFVNIIIDLQTLNSDTLVLDSYRIDSESIKSKSDGVEVRLYMTYKDNEEIGFNVKIYNEIQENSSSIVYTAIKSTDKMENNTDSNEIE